jgi:UDP-2-acetamido-3-amino-2,3-dideoxy-glucuronate N-acetyltransferase
MSVLLIGCGYWGANWAKALAGLGELGAICEASPEIQQTLKTGYPQVPLFTDLADALRYPGLEAAVVATPVMTHMEVARQCLLAGKHVLVEKPLALDPEEAEFLAKLAEGGGLILAVGHLLLYHPALIQLKALMDAGALGEILSVQCTRVNLGKIRNEENVWWSLAPHDLSIISLLLGESTDDEPLTLQSVSGLSLLKRPGLEDSVQAHLLSASGKSASVQVSWLAPVKKHETLVIGSQAMAIFDDALPAGQKLQILEYDLSQDGQRVQHIQRGESRFVDYESFMTQPNEDLLTTQAKAFLQAIRGQRHALPNDSQNGVQVVRLLWEVQQKINSSQPVMAI